MCWVCLLRKSSSLVNDCLRCGTVFDPTNKATDIWDVSDLGICVLDQIKVDVETIQLWVLWCEYAFMEKHEHKSHPLKVFIPFGKCDWYDMLEVSMVWLGRVVLAPQCRVLLGCWGKCLGNDNTNPSRSSGFPNPSYHLLSSLKWYIFIYPSICLRGL